MPEALEGPCSGGGGFAIRERNELPGPSDVKRRVSIGMGQQIRAKFPQLVGNHPVNSTDVSQPWHWGKNPLFWLLASAAGLVVPPLAP